jgi:hypothetical protein
MSVVKMLRTSRLCRFHRESFIRAIDSIYDSKHSFMWIMDRDYVASHCLRPSSISSKSMGENLHLSIFRCGGKAHAQCKALEMF